MMYLPSGLLTTLLTQALCPFKVRKFSPVCASHSVSAWSLLPEMIRLPSELKAKHLTGLSGPLRVKTSLPVAAVAWLLRLQQAPLSVKENRVASPFPVVHEEAEPEPPPSPTSSGARPCTGRGRQPRNSVKKPMPIIEPVRDQSAPLGRRPGT